MSLRRINPRQLQAIILGRVERLLGSDCDVNPYPEKSDLWEAFRDGWFRALDDSIFRELSTRGMSRNWQKQASSTATSP